MTARAAGFVHLDMYHGPDIIVVYRLRQNPAEQRIGITHKAIYQSDADPSTGKRQDMTFCIAARHNRTSRKQFGEELRETR